MRQIRIRKIKLAELSAKRVAVMLSALYFFLAPFEDLLTSNIGTFGKFIIIPVMGCLLIPTVRRKKAIFSKEIWKISRLVIYLILLAWVSIIWASNVSVAFRRNSAYTTLPLVFIVYSMHTYSKNEYQLLKNAALLGGLAAIVYILVVQGVQHVLSDRITLVAENDSNNLAALFLLPTGIAFDYMLKANGGRKLIYLFPFLILVYFTLLTGSRGGLLSIFVMIFAYCIASGYIRKFDRMLLFIGLAAVLTIVVIYFLPKEMLNRLFSYDSYANAAKSSQQRGAIWKHAIMDVIPKMKPWGHGSGCAFSMLAGYYGADTGTHNTYLCMILEYGILGIPCFILLLARLVHKLKATGNIIEYALLFGIMCTIFFLDAYAKKFFWNIMYLVVIRIQVVSEKTDGNNQFPMNDPMNEKRS